jgi:HlyD family type I secretion membrane fusion protein
MLTDAPIILSTVQRDEFLPPISRWTTLGGMLLVATVGAGVALVALTPYTVTVKAAATVLPTGETRLVQSAATATVKQILVQTGQPVRKGEAIAILDASQLQTKTDQLSNSILNIQQQLQQREARLQALDQQIVSEAKLAKQAIGSAQADLRLTQRDYQDRKVTAQARVQEAAATLELARTGLQKYRELAQTGGVSTLQMQEKEEAFNVAQARLTQAQALLNPSAESVTVASTQIAQNQAKGASTLAMLTQDREHWVQEQLELQNQLNRDRKELQQLQNDLATRTLTATADGTLLKSNLRNPGQVVQVGETIAQITPSQTPLTIKAQVSAQDVAKIKVCPIGDFVTCPIGQVYVRISAYPYPDYGTLKGVVRGITADVLPQSLAQSPAQFQAQYYEVTIQPEQSYLERDGQHYRIQPGMEAIAEIVSQRETVLMLMLRKVRLLANS